MSDKIIILPLLPLQYMSAVSGITDIYTCFFKPNYRLDPEKVESALQMLVQRHESLRMRIGTYKQAKVQLVYPYRESSLLVRVDCRNFKSEEEIESCVAEVREGLVLGMNSENDSVSFRCALFEYADDQRVFVAINHNCFDGVSITLFFHELHSLLTGGQLLPLSQSYSDLVKKLYAMVAKWNWQDDQAYWLRQHSLIRPLPQADGTAVGQLTRCKFRVVHREPWVFQLVSKVPTVAKVKVRDLMLAAWVQTLSEWTGAPGATFLLTAHGRNMCPGMLQTLGSFATSYPLFIAASDSGALAAAAQVSAQLSGIPHQGTRYRWLMCNQQWRTLVNSQPQPPLTFNYIGLRSDWKLTDGESGDRKMLSIRDGQWWRMEPSVSVSPYLSLSCVIANEFRSLAIECDYGGDGMNEILVKNLLESFAQKLRHMTMEILAGSAHFSAQAAMI